MTLPASLHPWLTPSAVVAVGGAFLKIIHTLATNHLRHYVDELKSAVMDGDTKTHEELAAISGKLDALIAVMRERQ